MTIIHYPNELQEVISELKSEALSIGLVPTMGALHEGHLSLIRESSDENNVTVVSIFVNPTQFGEGEDLDKYPRTFDDDVEAAKKAGASIIFAPTDDIMYPDGYSSEVSVKELSEKLEGEIRPGHFNGVTTVVLKLFNSALPDVAYFGQKDAQQAIIIKKMVEDLNVPVEVRVMPIIRDEDGLALSSRNRYLSQDERKEAPSIQEGLFNASMLYREGETKANKLKFEIDATYRKCKTFDVEYIVIVNTKDLEPVETIEGSTLIAVAVKTKESGTRLIDNIVIGDPL